MVHYVESYIQRIAVEDTDAGKINKNKQK